ncbi:MAG: glucose 1-dehydrogenase [Deltaproteobacteria bacterium]|nr:glucose 1-dehydrogenase [Deltaproteobacteria bacterium]MBZ0219238.1 glucose 1-dehydrogenase [Deltaproteobacteria bacterium]
MTGLFSLAGKTALVTGGGSGLGQAIAVGLSRAGASVAVAGRDVSKLDETVRLIAGSGGSAFPVRMDILDGESVRQAVQESAKKGGGIHILVNSAGVHLKKPTLEVTEEEWSRVLDTNLTGAFRVCRAVGTIMKKQGGGKIINIASLGSFRALKDAAAYTSSKAGLVLLTMNLAVELAPDNIQVNAIAPGVFRTALNEKVLVGERLERILANTPMQRLGRAEELAGTAVYLASAASDFVTGAVIPVDGGFLAWGI